MRAMSAGAATRAACSAIAPSMNSRARSSSNGPSITGTPARRRERRGLDDIDPRADADAYPALDFQRDQRFADRRPRDLQLFGEIPFGRQPAADGVFAAVDQGAQLIGNLAIKTPRLHGFERHARFSLNDPGGVGGGGGGGGGCSGDIGLTN